MADVRFDNICKTFGHTTVLQGIDLTVRDRELMVLVGPSGCGKSTLLRLLAGLENPTQGTIAIGDRPINHLPPKQRDIAMVFQNYALYPHLNVYQNLAFGLKRQGQRHWNPLSTERRKKYRTIDERVRTVAAQLQLDPLLQRKPKELSGGQKQRVALGRAMARNPQVFLLDEPLSNLDAQLRGETRSQIVQLQRKLQVTTIYVTHDQVEAMTMGDRITVLQGGRIQQVDTPLNLYRYPANEFVARFIGSPPMNVLPVALASDGCLHGSGLSQSIPLSGQQRSQLLPNQPLTLGFRPERAVPAVGEEAHLCGTVQLVEVLGAQSLVSVQVGDAAVQVSVAPELDYREGETVGWRLDPQQLYLFDRNTGRALLHPESPSRA
jgi:multiple sugar transport system ATP-binding protein